MGLAILLLGHRKQTADSPRGWNSPLSGAPAKLHSMETAERKFRDFLRDTISECRTIGYSPNRFAGMINQSNPFDAVRSLLSGRSVSEGFTTLWEKKRLDLSVEAIVLKPEWRDHFTDAELENARRRLADMGYQAPWDETTAPAPTPSPEPAASPYTLPPIPNTEALIARIRSLDGLPERNHEDVVKDLLIHLGHDVAAVVFQRGRIDLCLLDTKRDVAAVFEVKRSIATESERLGARRQAMDYATHDGAVIVVVTDGDRFEIYDRRKGFDYEAMLCAKFQLTRFRETDVPALDMLRPAAIASLRL